MELSQTTVTLLRQLTFLSFLWLSGFFPIIIDSNFDWTETRVSRKSKWSIHESVTRCVTGCYVTSGTVENLNTLWGIVWGTEYGRFTSINISKVRSSSFDRNDSDGKASFKRQRSPETTANTQDESTCKMFIFWNIYRCKSTILSRSTTMTNDRDMTTTVSQLLNFKTAMRGLRAKIIIFFIPYAVWITASC